jgi:UDPglucose--hexose-1-phosphate uridylyltransferase
MHVLEMRKPDGRMLRLYGQQPIRWADPAPSPTMIPHAAPSQLRWQPLRGEWVAYAPYRQSRTFLPPAKYDPLRPTDNPAAPTELPRGDYDIAVFDNLFPSLSGTPAAVPHLIVPARAGHGHCEVVVYSQDPCISLGALPLSHIELLLEVWGHRTESNGSEPACNYVLPFENRGIEVGVTLAHPHGQIYSYPFVPPVPRVMLENELTYYRASGKPLLEDLLAREAQTAERVLYLGPHAIAVVPVCARYSYEVWVAPRRAAPYLFGLESAVRADLARALKTVLMKFDRLWQRPMPYVTAWFQAPTDGLAHPEAHVHAEFYPSYRTREKLKYLAGTEIAAGMFASDSLPEEAARELQGVDVDVETPC